jgi:hypothetical protein
MLVAMILSRHLSLVAVCAVWLPCAADARKTYFSSPELANQSVGLLETRVRNVYYRGSASVALDERVLYSCAHIVYDRGVWAKDYTFHRAWHDQRFPARRLGASPRGFHYFTRYARAARYTDGESNASFANDFTVFYGTRSFGPAARVQEYSGAPLRSTREKRIIGYPSIIDFTRKRGFSYQHSTGWFPYRAFRVRDGYHDFFGVSTGSGNSGGGIFLRDPATGDDLLAGILVSGGFRNAGVVAMDSSTRSLARKAIGSSYTSWSVANANRISVEETGGTMVRWLPVHGPSGLLESVALDLDLSGIRGDIPAVFLQSPFGRIRRVAVAGAHAETVRIRDANLSDAFQDSDPAGTWKVRIRVSQGSTDTPWKPHPEKW